MASRIPSAHCIHSVAGAQKNASIPSAMPAAMATYATILVTRTIVCVFVQPQQPDQQKPQRNVKQHVDRLIEGARYIPGKGNAEEAIQNVDGDRRGRVYCHPNKQEFLAVAVPQNQAKEGDECPQVDQPIVKEIAADDLPFAFIQSERNRVRIAHLGKINAARLRRVEGVERSLPHPNGEYARRGAGERKGPREMAVIPGRMGRQLSVLPDQLPVPIHLVRVLPHLDENAVRGGLAGGGNNFQVAAVPGESAIGGIALLAPRGIGPDRTPSRVIPRRLRPAEIVAKMKLPIAIDGYDTLADIRDHENGRMGRRSRLRGFLPSLLARSRSGKQQQQSHDGLASIHAARISPGCSIHEQDFSR